MHSIALHTCVSEPTTNICMKNEDRPILSPAKLQPRDPSIHAKKKSFHLPIFGVERCFACLFQCFINALVFGSISVFPAQLLGVQPVCCRCFVTAGVSTQMVFQASDISVKKGFIFLYLVFSSVSRTLFQCCANKEVFRCTAVFRCLDSVQTARNQCFASQQLCRSRGVLGH